jgi:thioredoxin 2
VWRVAAAVVTCPSCGTRNRVRANPAAVPKCAKCGSRLPWAVDATESDFAEEVAAPVPVVLDLWAPWCGPCHMVSPILDKLAVDRAGEVKVVRVNVDDAPALAQRYRALSIPTLVVLRDGEEIDRIVGADPRLADRIAPHLSRASA